MKRKIFVILLILSATLNSQDPFLRGLKYSCVTFLGFSSTACFYNYKTTHELAEKIVSIDDNYNKEVAFKFLVNFFSERPGGLMGITKLNENLDNDKLIKSYLQLAMNRYKMEGKMYLFFGSVFTLLAILFSQQVET